MNVDGVGMRVTYDVPDPDKGELIRFDHVEASDQDFSGLRPKKVLGVVESRFTRCSFERLRAPRVCFGAGGSQSVYVECSFDHSRFKANAPGNARFERCTFRDVKIDYMIGDGLEFIDCVFTGQLKEVVFWGSVGMQKLARAYGRVTDEFTGNDLSGADLIDCGFRGGVDLTKNTLPPGIGTLVALDGAETLARVKRRVFEMPDTPLREQAMNLVKSNEMWLRGTVTQEHLWMRRDDRRNVMKGKLVPARELLFDLVKEESEALLRGS